MKYFEIAFTSNYYDGDVTVVVKLEDKENDSILVHLSREFKETLAQDMFGCSVGDYIEDDDVEEDDGEPFEIHFDITLVPEEELTAFDNVMSLEEFISGNWI